MSLSFFKLKLFSFSCFSRFIIILITTFSCGNVRAAVFEIQNNCSYTIWAAANPGGGRELHQGQNWVFNTDPNSNDTGRIWARTNCNFDANGAIKCDSGDCGGALHCDTGGLPPCTLAEYSFRKFNNLDFFDISLVDGFNVPMEVKGASSGCTKQIKCTGDINGLCPTELRHPGGCNNPCAVFKNDQFCCRSGHCSSTAYSKFFKNFCPNVYTYPLDDDATGTFTCPNGSDYKVVFCPQP